MTTFVKKKFFTFRSYGDGTESGVSWNWQTPKPYSSPSNPPSPPILETPTPPQITPSATPPSPSREKEQWERRGSGTSCITRTTHYSPSSGFVTEVSTTSSPPLSASASPSPPSPLPELEIVNSSPLDTLVLTRSSHSPSSNNGENNNKMTASYDTLPRSEGLKIGGLVSLDPSLVTSIAVAGISGSLLTLSSNIEAKNQKRVEAVNSVFRSFQDSNNNNNNNNIFYKQQQQYSNSNNIYKNKTGHINSRSATLVHDSRGSPIVSKHNQFVSNIQFGSLNNKTRTHLDSLVTSSLLDFTRPKPNLSKRQEEEEEEEDGVNCLPAHLSATVLDRGEEDLNNLYRTISRKRILSKVQCSNFHMHEEGQECPNRRSQMFHCGLFKDDYGKGPADATGHSVGTVRPLAKILARMHGVQHNENTYASLGASDSLYTSLTRQDDNNNINNNNSNSKSSHKKEKAEACCHVLLSSLAASQSETQCHALSGCLDCLEYSSALHASLPRLLSKQNSKQGCNLHHYGAYDPEMGFYPPAGMYGGWGQGGPRAPSRRKEGKVVCYLAGVIMAILALVTVIVVLTMMVANQEMRDINQF